MSTLFIRVVGTKLIGPIALYIERYVPLIFFARNWFRGTPRSVKSCPFFNLLAEVEQLIISAFHHNFCYKLGALSGKVFSSKISYVMSLLFQRHHVKLPCQCLGRVDCPYVTMGVPLTAPKQADWQKRTPLKGKVAPAIWLNIRSLLLHLDV